MKKIFSILTALLALAWTGAVAQNNRMVVVGKDGSKKAYMVENVDSIFFAKVNGTASLSLNVNSVINSDPLNPLVKATIKMEGLCSSYRYTVVPKQKADMMDDTDVIRYFDTFFSEKFTEDLNNQVLTGTYLTTGTQNTILAVAYDEFNVGCSVARADFEIAGDFDVEVTEVKEISMKLNIKPADQNMLYFVRCEEQKKLEGISDKALFDKEKAYFEKMAEDYQTTLDDVLNWNCQYGEQTDFELSGYKTGTDYTIYVYGIKDGGFESATGIMRIPVHTAEVKKIDVDFNISAEVVDGFYIDATFAPVNYDGSYSLDVIEVDENMNDRDIKDMIESDWCETAALYLSFDYTPEDIQNELCKNGEFSFLFEKEANKTYVAYAYAVNENAMLCSDVKFVKVKTGDVPRSENKINIMMEKLTPYNAMLRFTPTIDDETYAVYGAPATEFEGLEGEALMKYINDQYPMTFTGEMQIEMAPLLPRKDFRVFAYGCAAGAPTTELFELSYTTPDPVYDEGLLGKMNYGKYYDSEAVAELDPSYSKFAKKGVVFVPSDIVQVGGESLYTAFFGDVDIVGKTDEDIVSWMLYNPDKYLARPGTEYNILRAPYGMEITGVAFVVAKDGSFSKLFKGEKLIIEQGGEGDPQEFVDNYPLPVKGSKAMTQPAELKAQRGIIKADPSKVVHSSVTTAHAGKIKMLKNRR